MIARSSWPLAAVIALGLAIISIASSCTKNQRVTTIRASLVTVNTARDEFVSWDLEHQRALLLESKTRDEALAKVAAYEDKRRKAVDGFEIAYRALALAATQTDGPSLTAAMSAVKELYEAIAKLKADASKGSDVRDTTDASTDTPPTQGAP